MVAITLPDGAIRTYDGPVTVKDVAASIGPGLAKAALAGKVGDSDRSIEWLDGPVGQSDVGHDSLSYETGLRARSGHWRQIRSLK